MTTQSAQTSGPASGAAPSALVISWGELRSLLARRAAVCERLAGSLDRIAFGLLLLATAALLLRPADVFSALAGDPVYAVCIAACLVASLRRLLDLFTARSLRSNAILMLVLLLVPAVMLSHLAHADTWNARLGGIEMAKACLLFLLVVALVDSASRFKAVLFAATASVVAAAALSLLNYYGVLNLPAFAGAAQRPPEDGAPALIRLYGSGVFNDPNDFSLVLVLAMSVCFYALGERRARRARGLIFAALAILGYALILTHSRGGLLAAVVACLAFLPARFGRRNALPLAAAAALLLLLPFWGRQTTLNLHDPEDTFQTRLGLWSDSLDAFRSAPLFGVGQGNLVEAIGQVAHNSFLHAFAETGLFGGTLFVGAFYLILRGLCRASPTDPELARLRPFVLAVTAGYAAGLLTLSRCYTVPTQLILGLATAYLVLASSHGRAAVARLDWRCIRGLAGVATVFLCVTYLFVRLMVQRGA